MTYRNRYRPGELAKAINAARVDAAEAAMAVVAAGTASSMRNTGPTEARNRSSTLRSQSGAFLRAVAGKRGRGGRIERKRMVSGSRVIYLILVAYGALHEFGGLVRVTARMRRFFWARYYDTGLEKYKRMAITRKRRFRFRERAPVAKGIARSGRRIERAVETVLKTKLDAAIRRM